VRIFKVKDYDNFGRSMKNAARFEEGKKKISTKKTKA